MKKTMGLIGVWIFVLLLVGISCTSTKEDINTQIVVPLWGERTLLRFIVKVRGNKPVIVYGPFANETRLVVTHPNGERKEHFNWKMMPRPPEPVNPGEEYRWDVDISKWIEINSSGTYTVSFTVNGHESNQITFVRE